LFATVSANLAPGLRHQGADNNANCDPGTNTNSGLADYDANSTSNRYPKTNSDGQEFTIFFAGCIAHGNPFISKPKGRSVYGFVVLVAT
jgi:hypothetical protein